MPKGGIRPLCIVDGCLRLNDASGYCELHYRRWKSTGTTDAPSLPTLAERFWAKVNKEGPIQPHCPELGPCWVWTAAKRYRGYGQINIDGIPEKAHRVSFLLHFGYLPVVVMHRCDNPPCINPSHLASGTRDENHLDAKTKGRLRGKVQVGEANPQAKLTVEIVREARTLHTSGWSLHKLAARYEVDRKTITQAIRGEHWSHA